MELKPEIKKWLEELNPQTVVDIGPGQGNYAKLAKKKGQHWTGIEVFAPYVTEYDLNSLYDTIIIGDACYIEDAQFMADVVIAGDVIEHMTREDAEDLIHKALSQAKHMIISIPIIHWPQEPREGNWFEKHLHHWTYEDMKELLGDRLVDSVKGKKLGAFLIKEKS